MAANKGMPIKLPKIITKLFVMYDFFSYLSLIIPPKIVDENTHVIRDMAFSQAYVLLNSGNTRWKNTGRNAIEVEAKVARKKPAINMFLHTVFLHSSWVYLKKSKKPPFFSSSSSSSSGSFFTSGELCLSGFLNGSRRAAPRKPRDAMAK